MCESYAAPVFCASHHGDSVVSYAACCFLKALYRPRLYVLSTFPSVNENGVRLVFVGIVLVVGHRVALDTDIAVLPPDRFPVVSQEVDSLPHTLDRDAVTAVYKGWLVFGSA